MRPSEIQPAWLAFRLGRSSLRVLENLRRCKFHSEALEPKRLAWCHCDAAAITVTGIGSPKGSPHQQSSREFVFPQRAAIVPAFHSLHLAPNDRLPKQIPGIISPTSFPYERGIPEYSGPYYTPKLLCTIACDGIPIAFSTASLGAGNRWR